MPATVGLALVVRVKAWGREEARVTETKGKYKGKSLPQLERYEPLLALSYQIVFRIHCNSRGNGGRQPCASPAGRRTRRRAHQQKRGPQELEDEGRRKQR